MEVIKPHHVALCILSSMVRGVWKAGHGRPAASGCTTRRPAHHCCSTAAAVLGPLRAAVQRHLASRLRRLPEQPPWTLPCPT